MNDPTPPPSPPTPPPLPPLPPGVVLEGQQAGVADAAENIDFPAVQGPAEHFALAGNEGVRGVFRGRQGRGGRRGRGRAVHAFGAFIAHQPAPPVDPFPPPVEAEGEQVVAQLLAEILQFIQLRDLRRHRHGRGDASSVLEFPEFLVQAPPHAQEQQVQAPPDAEEQEEPQQGAGAENL